MYVCKLKTIYVKRRPQNLSYVPNRPNVAAAAAAAAAAATSVYCHKQQENNRETKAQKFEPVKVYILFKQILENNVAVTEGDVTTTTAAAEEKSFDEEEDSEQKTAKTKHVYLHI